MRDADTYTRKGFLCFIKQYHCGELLFANGLREQKIPFEMHIYPQGAHGLSLATEETDEGGGQDAHISGWMKLCTEWLRQTFNTPIGEN